MRDSETILVVDDDPQIRMALTDRLAAHGYKVYQAINGKEGLETIARHEIDLMLLDLRMPVMDGVFTWERMENGKTRFEYIAIADPGIALPAWILNAFSVSQPYNTLYNIKTEVKEPIYYERASKRHKKEFKKQ